MNAQAMVWSIRRELWENRSLYKLAQHYNFAALLLMGTTAGRAGHLCPDKTYYILDQPLPDGPSCARASSANP